MVASVRKLSDGEIEARISGFAKWEVLDGKLRRELVFGDFVEAFAFMASLALVAQERNHHPEWFNVYNRVVVEWNTHDVGGLSELDFEMAAATDRLADTRG